MIYYLNFNFIYHIFLIKGIVPFINNNFILINFYQSNLYHFNFYQFQLKINIFLLMKSVHFQFFIIYSLNFPLIN